MIFSIQYFYILFYISKATVADCGAAKVLGAFGCRLRILGRDILNDLRLIDLYGIFVLLFVDQSGTFRLLMVKVCSN